MTKILNNLDLSLNSTIEKCLRNEYSKIYKVFRTALSNWTLVRNILNKNALIKSKIDLYLQSDKSSCASGKCIRKITNIAIYWISISTLEDPHRSDFRKEKMILINSYYKIIYLEIKLLI